jgi:hypothetical protein
MLAAVLLSAALLPTPSGWREETFDFPLRFAAEIPLEGKEHVRFSPQWAKFSTEEGFTYAILWDVKSKPLTADDFEDFLETYFKGLMHGVAPVRKLEIPATPTAAALHPMTAIDGWEQSFGAEVRTWNAFSRAEPLLLWGEITERPCPGGRMQVFFAFSRAQRDRPAWKALRDIRKATTCGE